MAQKAVQGEAELGHYWADAIFFRWVMRGCWHRRKAEQVDCDDVSTKSFGETGFGSGEETTGAGSFRRKCA